MSDLTVTLAVDEWVLVVVSLDLIGMNDRNFKLIADKVEAQINPELEIGSTR